MLSINTKPRSPLPFLLAIGIIVLDQVSKAWVVANIPLNTIHSQFFGDFLRIIHVRNLGIAFSLGGDAPGIFRTLVFLIIPTLLMVGLMVYNTFSVQLTNLQRWFLAGIIGGGIGNLYDRYFRPDGVVDFIDVKFYGIFGLERWPTWNIADASVVVCGIALAIHLAFFQKGRV